VPELAMIVIVERAFFHCGKCVTRAKLGIMRGIGNGLMHCPQSLRRHELLAPTVANCGGYHWDRLLRIIGSPFAGRKVTRSVGHTACAAFS